jgi:hypothetical protein
MSFFINQYGYIEMTCIFLKGLLLYKFWTLTLNDTDAAYVTCRCCPIILSSALQDGKEKSNSHEVLESVVWKQVYYSVHHRNILLYVGFEVSMAVTMRNVVFWNVALCRCCEN